MPMEGRIKGDEAMREGVLKLGIQTRIANRDDRSREMFRLIGGRLSRCGSKLNDLDRGNIRYEGKIKNQTRI